MEQQQDLLLDIEQEFTLEPASTGARFVNYIIDVIGIYIVFIFIGVAYGIYLASTHSSFNRSSFGGLQLFVWVAELIVLMAYYTLLEGLTKGKSLGKLVTRTKVVKEDGSPIDLNDAFIRSLCRLVPFEPFSAFGGHPWHDRWSKTIVIKQ